MNSQYLFENPKRGSRFKDLTGMRFGRLSVLDCAGPDSRREMQWRCTCDCGMQVVTLGYSLRAGLTQSCGCFKRQQARVKNTKHGMSKTPIYSIWSKIMDRCYCENNPAYCNYGGRGIEVSDSWRTFENFFADMGHRPDGMSLDRKDNNRNYSVENCRWATRTEQARNTRKNRFFSFDGKTLCINEWAELFNINKGTLYFRLNSMKWPIDRALLTPIGAK